MKLLWFGVRWCFLFCVVVVVVVVVVDDDDDDDDDDVCENGLGGDGDYISLRN